MPAAVSGWRSSKARVVLKLVYEVGPREAAAYQTWPAPDSISSSAYGWNTWMTSASPAASAAAFFAIVPGAVSCIEAGSMPALRKSYCRQIHGVGTSVTTASPVNGFPGSNLFPTSEDGFPKILESILF